jgi:hypothetical protein
MLPAHHSLQMTINGFFNLQLVAASEATWHVTIRMGTDEACLLYLQGVSCLHV